MSEVLIAIWNANNAPPARRYRTKRGRHGTGEMPKPASGLDGSSARPENAAPPTSSDEESLPLARLWPYACGVRLGVCCHCLASASSPTATATATARASFLLCPGTPAGAPDPASCSLFSSVELWLAPVSQPSCGPMFKLRMQEIRQHLTDGCLQEYYSISVSKR